jgi:hypothetical protein
VATLIHKCEKGLPLNGRRKIIVFPAIISFSPRFLPQSRRWQLGKMKESAQATLADQKLALFSEHIIPVLKVYYCLLHVFRNLPTSCEEEEEVYMCTYKETSPNPFVTNTMAKAFSKETFSTQPNLQLAANNNKEGIGELRIEPGSRKR